MSRHRNIRAIDVDEEYDGYYSCYGHSVEDDFCISPQTEAEFLYSRPKTEVGAFLRLDESVPEEEIDEEDFVESDFKSDLNSVDAAKLQSCVEAMQDVVGDSIPEAILQKAAYDHGFDLEKALHAVLLALKIVCEEFFIQKFGVPKDNWHDELILFHADKQNYKKLDEPFADMNKAPKGQRGTSVHSSNNETNKRNGSEICLEAVDVKLNPVNCPNVKNKKVKVQANTSKKDTTQQETTTTKSCGNAQEASLSNEKCETKDLPNGMSDLNKLSISDEKNCPNESSASDEKSEINETPRSQKSSQNIEDLYRKERGNEKTCINLVVVGHVDAGKSTLMGHLLFKLGQVSKKTMHKFEQDSKKLGKSSFMYAWVLDETPEERNRGITMDVAETKFETSSKSVILLDAPGHKDFIPNMITGAAQADAAVLVVDSTKGEFETGFETGGQTREHTMLIRSLGVSQIVVAVNKMDNVNWAQERFLEIKSKLTAFLRTVGYKESDATFVPCSGLTGENLTTPAESPELKKWYQGPTIVDVIDGFQPPERPVNKPLRMCIYDVFKGITGGFCLAGKIDSGFIRTGDKVIIMPAGEQGSVKSITMDEVAVQHSFAGESIIIQVNGIDINNVTTGSVVCDIDRPIKVTSLFEARLVIFNVVIPVTRGFPVILHYQSMCEQAIIKNIISQLNRSTGEVIKKKPRCLTKNTSAIVEIEVNRPICIELFKDFKALGRFMLRYGGTTIAAGLVTSIK